MAGLGYLYINGDRCLQGTSSRCADKNQKIVGVCDNLSLFLTGILKHRVLQKYG